MTTILNLPLFPYAVTNIKQPTSGMSTPDAATENEEFTIIWDIQFHMDRAIKANKSDLIIKSKKEKFCTLIDMAVPSDRNTSVKVAKKLSKYKDLEIEIARMRRMKLCQLSSEH